MKNTIMLISAFVLVSAFTISAKLSPDTVDTSNTHASLNVDEQALWSRAFLDAAFNHDIETIKEMFAHGIDVNTTDENGDTALMLALNPKPNINACSSEQIVPLLQILLDYGADTTASLVLHPLSIKKTALRLVAGWGLCLLDDDSSGVAKMGCCACKKGIIKSVMKLLLSHGAAGYNNVLALDALRLAQHTAKKGNTEALEALEEYLSNAQNV